MSNNIQIRKERESDFKAIREVNIKAFKQPQEADLIDKIKSSDDHILSLVAVINYNVVGHIFFSPVECIDHKEIKNSMGLAPMAVLPEYQNQGIGSMLVNSGINRLKKQSVPFVIVLGQKSFYPRFGFEPASRYKLKSQWKNIPDEVFMVVILDKSIIRNLSGIVKYRNEFNEAM